MKNTSLVLFGAISKSLVVGIAFCLGSCASEEKQPSSSAQSKVVKVADEDAYLVDMTTTVRADVEPGQATPFSKIDIKSADRISKIAARAMEIADLDKSEYLSWEEFSDAVERVRAAVRARLIFQPSEAQKAKVSTQIRAEFEKAAGSDELLDEQELKYLLQSQAQRVANLRARGLGLMAQQN